MTPTTRTWVDNGTLDFKDPHGRRSAHERSRWRTTRSSQARKNGRGTACHTRPVGRTRPVSVEDRAVAPFGGHSRISAPMLMVWLMGNPKYSTGFAELWAMVKNSRFCQPGMVGRVERATVILDRK